MDRAVAETVIKEFIMEYAALPPSYGEVEMEPMFDEERGHYQLAQTKFAVA